MIRFENVSFGYPQKDLYEDISFSIERGEHVALIGSNGCGKTSLIQLITALRQGAPGTLLEPH